MTVHGPLSRIPGVLLATDTLLLASCGGGNAPAGGPPGGPGGAPAVTVMPVEAADVTLTTELPGRTAPSLVAEVRPQVGGIIRQRLFAEGGTVKAGQALYQIDPAIFQANVDSAAAALARAEANRDMARLKANRHAELVKTGAVSQQAHEEAQAGLKQAEADVGAARAALDRARVDLDFTRLASPISGRIGRSAVTPGALVTANQAAALATIQQLDPIYVDLSQSSTEMARLNREFAQGKLRRLADGKVPVTLTLEDGSAYAQAGTLAFSEVSVDPQTGTVALRAVFPNPDGTLLPGMFVRAKLAQGVREGAVRVPHAAVSRDPLGNAQVMVVGTDNVVQPRPVQVAQSEGSEWVVTDGLAAGDRVITEGLQRARPGATVTPLLPGEAPEPPAGSPAGAPAAAPKTR
ncbi:MAG: efflux RND transporter periplasmic adaptor subunit [Gammaproteobacteria bacterium]